MGWRDDWGDEELTLSGVAADTFRTTGDGERIGMGPMALGAAVAVYSNCTVPACGLTARGDADVL